MLIVSWNVAGLKPALQRIHEDYGPSSCAAISKANDNATNNTNFATKITSENTANSSSTKPQRTTTSSSTNNKKFCPFTNYLQLHGNVDILCLQEHKIPLSQLSSRSEPHRCSTIPGYESFWSCATDQKSRGFNGVVTYVKSGMVLSADSAPLQDAELDSQGRCVLTDHGMFVVFNVYVPNGIHPNKMKFLRALQCAMRKQREGGKHVMLIGDMNLKIDKRDIYWKHRVLNVDDVLLQQQRKEDGGQQHCSQNANTDAMDDNVANENDEVTLPKWKADVCNNWAKITSVLETLEAVPCQTTNPNTKQTFDRWRARVKLPDGKYVILGTYEDSAEDALCQYKFHELIYEDPNTNTRTICRKKNLLCVEVLTELMFKIANVTWNPKMQREVADSREADLNPDSPAYVWVKGLLEEDGMVDVFRHMYPDAEGRFTCWHQQRNKRYSNEGGRIDFTLVDKALLEHVDTSGSLRCGTQPHTDPLGEEAALMACTSNGNFQAPSFSGGGIAQVSKRALDSQFGEPHTGMIYTPPSYSDHIAISLLMKQSFKDGVDQMVLQSNSSTKKSQPHKKQKSMMSFLCAPGAATKKSSSSSSTSTASSSTTASAATAGQKRPAAKQEVDEDTKSSKPNNLKSYFGNAAQTKTSSSKNSTAKPAAGSKTNSGGQDNNKKHKKNSLFNHFSKK